MAVAQGRLAGVGKIVLEIDGRRLGGGDKTEGAVRERIDEKSVAFAVRSIGEDAGRSVIVGNHGGLCGFVADIKWEGFNPSKQG